MAPTTDPLSQFGTKQTPQSQAVPGRVDQVENNADGFVFTIDRFAQLRRFLTIGTAAGTYYVGESKLTEENGKLVIELTNSLADHLMMVDIIVEISVAGRAPKPNQALFALAIACQMGETEGKQYARSKIQQVVRTGTHLFTFIGYLEQFGGLGRGLRRALGAWYSDKEVDDLALQLIKYRQRDGWTHRDVLRKTHPKIKVDTDLETRMSVLERDLLDSDTLERENEAKAAIERLEEEIEGQRGRRAAIDWAVGKKTEDRDNLPDFIKFFEQAQAKDANIPDLLRKTYLPWEALPDRAMNDVATWHQLISNGMPITALVRQLPRLTSIGVIESMGGGYTNDIVAQLTNEHKVRKSRIHPIQVLVALRTYRQGRGEKGKLTWTPSPRIIDALDDMFYMSFVNVIPTGKRIMNCLDVSGSMGSAAAGNLPLTAREVSAAMSMVNLKTESNIMTVGFTSKSGYGYMRADDTALTDLPLSGRQRLDDVVNTISGLRFGATDCSLPMVEALHRDLKVDAFVVYTDNETWHGGAHPFQALEQYRKSSGIDAKLVVVAATPTKFSIADPRDPGMLDISGFDSATPALIADFIRGDV